MGKEQQARFAAIAAAIVILTIVGTLLGLAWLQLNVKAGPAALPPRPPTPGAPSGTGSDDDDSGGGPIGAYIELHTHPVTPGVWSLVQWQDSDDHWHNVDGWQGDLDSTGTRRWWVDARDFGTGPFRWLVLQRPNDQPLATSASFHLPQGANEILRIEVSLTP